MKKKENTHENKGWRMCAEKYIGLSTIGYLTGDYEPQRNVVWICRAWDWVVEINDHIVGVCV